VYSCVALRKFDFDPDPVHLRTVKKEVTPGQVFLGVLRPYHISILPP